MDVVSESKNGAPVDVDYEYLVSWEGYSDEDNSWEPYENVKHCTEKLNELMEREKARKAKGAKLKRKIQKF